MPVGILVLKWDNEVGPVLMATYPETLDPPRNLQTQIYSAHRYSSLKPGFGKLTLKNNKIVSFFSGLGDDYIEVENYVVALLLRRDENANEYKDVLKKIASQILSNIKNEKYKKMIRKLYEDYLIKGKK
ncbi:MAG: hypothetical protein ACTSRZ_13300 [Promethearchaeota archaeon]